MKRGATTTVAALAFLCATGAVAVAATGIGTDGPDRLVGTPAPDQLYGEAGDDQLLGLGGTTTSKRGPATTRSRAPTAWT